jgi:phosphohistidine phosphatase
MHLLLLRHADADTVATNDDERRLSEKGIEQAGKVGRFCESNGIQISLILSSPVRRAHETARIVSEHLEAEVQVVPWLACGMHPHTALEELVAYRSHSSVMIVGHEPDFSQLIATLLAMPSNAQLHIRKASLTALELHSFRPGAGQLDYTIPCRLM